MSEGEFDLTDEEVEEIIAQVEADERRSRRTRMLVIFIGMCIAWMCGAMCAVSAVGG